MSVFNTINSKRAQKAGRVSTEKKAAAVRLNGLKGGRPSKDLQLNQPKTTQEKESQEMSLTPKTTQLGQLVSVQYRIGERDIKFVGIVTMTADSVAYVRDCDYVTENDRGVIRRGGGAAFPAEPYPYTALSPTLRTLRVSNETERANDGRTRGGREGWE